MLIISRKFPIHVIFVAHKVADKIGLIAFVSFFFFGPDCCYRCWLELCLYFIGINLLHCNLFWMGTIERWRNPTISIHFWFLNVVCSHQTKWKSIDRIRKYFDTKDNKFRIFPFLSCFFLFKQSIEKRIASIVDFLVLSLS